MDKLKNPVVAKQLKFVLLKLKEVNDLQIISNVKKLKWCSYCYRIRIGDYRLGFRYDWDKIILDVFLHRKDMYKFYPPKN